MDPALYAAVIPQKQHLDALISESWFRDGGDNHTQHISTLQNHSNTV